MGIGCRRDPLEANVWYVKAAAAGDERAKHRIAAINAAASGGNLPGANSKPRAKRIHNASQIAVNVPVAASPVQPEKKDKEKECVVM